MVIGWFTRIVVVLALVLVVGYDGVTIAAAHFGAGDDAGNAAGAAASYVKNNPGRWTADDAYAAAEQSLSHGETIDPKTFHVNADGSVTLSVHRDVERTLVAHHLGFLHKELSFDDTVTVDAPQ